MKLLPSFCSSLNSRVKIFVFVAISGRHFFIFFCDLMKDQKKRTQIQRSSLPFDVRPRNVKLNLSNISTDPTNKAKRSVCFGGDQLYMLRPLKSVGNGCA